MGPTPAKVGRVNAGLLWNSSHRSGLIPGPILVVVRKINFNPDPRALKRARQ